MVCIAGIVQPCMTGAIKKGELLTITTESDNGISTESCHWLCLPTNVIKNKLHENPNLLAGMNDLDVKHQIIVCDSFSLGYVKGGVDSKQSGKKLWRKLRKQHAVEHENAKLKKMQSRAKWHNTEQLRRAKIMKERRAAEGQQAQGAPHPPAAAEKYRPDGRLSRSTLYEIVGSNGVGGWGRGGSDRATPAKRGACR
ncbi:hypothetical protein GGF32_009406 [Allomyces javanicus]|nr:hypothetical protein GGF32_009406 [Allomyces javanicus]